MLTIVCCYPSAKLRYIPTMEEYYPDVLVVPDDFSPELQRQGQIMGRFGPDGFIWDNESIVASE